MTIKVIYPDRELVSVLMELEALEDRFSGPDWFYIPSEKPMYLVRKLTLEKEILRLQNTDGLPYKE